LGGVGLANVITDQKVKEYLLSGTRKITKVIPSSDYILTLEFDNGEIRTFDMSDKLFGVFEILKDKAKFKEAFVDEHGNIAWDKDKAVDSKIVWNNRMDICKDSLYLASTPVIEEASSCRSPGF
jgi:hypothetical protein